MAPTEDLRNAASTPLAGVTTSRAAALERLARSAATAPRQQRRILSKTFWSEMGTAHADENLAALVRQSLARRGVVVDVIGPDEFGTERRHAWVILTVAGLPVVEPQAAAEESASPAVVPQAPAPRQAAFEPIQIARAPARRSVLGRGGRRGFANPDNVLVNFVRERPVGALVIALALLAATLYASQALLRSAGNQDAGSAIGSATIIRLATGTGTPTVSPTTLLNPTVAPTTAAIVSAPASTPTATTSPRPPTPTRTATPRPPTATPLPPSPTPQPTATPQPTGGVTFISITGGPPGSIASASVQTWPEASCSIDFIRPAGTHSTAGGLMPKSADAGGIVQWTWKIWELSETGTGTVVVTCNGVSASAPIEVAS